MYDPDEIEEEQREREKRNKINADFKQFTTRVQVGAVCGCVCGGGVNGSMGWLDDLRRERGGCGSSLLYCA
jgi:hypothetical protein